MVYDNDRMSCNVSICPSSAQYGEYKPDISHLMIRDALPWAAVLIFCLYVLRYPSIVLGPTSAEALAGSSQASSSHALKLRGILKHARTDTGTLFATLATTDFLKPLEQFVSILRGQGHDHAVLVACLDNGCSRRSQSSTGLLFYDALGGRSVARAKFTLINTLLELDRDFVLFDGDVYLNASRNVFADVLPKDATWDLQAQRDRSSGNLVNIGWLWIKATAISRLFWGTAQAQYNRWPDWDQTAVNRLLENFETPAPHRNEVLRVHRLPEARYVNYMLHDMRDVNAPSRLPNIENAAMVHLTCVETPLKSYIAKELGLWSDVDGYYSTPSRLLQLSELRGTLPQLSVTMNALVKLARLSNRKLLLPTQADIVDDDGVVRPMLSHEVFHFGQLSQHIVESSYLMHRQRFTKDQMRTRLITVTKNQDVEALIQQIRGHGDTDVVQLRMSVRLPDRDKQRWPLCESLRDGRGCLRVCGREWLP